MKGVGTGKAMTHDMWKRGTVEGATEGMVVSRERAVTRFCPKVASNGHKQVLRQRSTATVREFRCPSSFIT